jgi:hypothetical protein
MAAPMIHCTMSTTQSPTQRLGLLLQDGRTGAKAFASSRVTIWSVQNTLLLRSEGGTFHPPGRLPSAAHNALTSFHTFRNRHCPST